jgi:hydrogenase maturation protease
MLADRGLGVGSPHGDDAAGWRVVERLRQHSGLTAQLKTIEPSQLLDHLDDCRRLILVDAYQSNQPPGTILRLQWPDSRLRSQRRRSSHALGLGDALALAETLGWLPPRVVVWGVEISRTEPGEDLTPEVCRVLPELERQVLQELACVTSEPNDE